MLLKLKRTMKLMVDERNGEGGRGGRRSLKRGMREGGVGRWVRGGRAGWKGEGEGG